MCSPPRGLPFARGSDSSTQLPARRPREEGTRGGNLDPANDLRTSTAGARVIDGPLGVTAYKTGSQTMFLSRDPAGNLPAADRNRVAGPSP